MQNLDELNNQIDSIVNNAIDQLNKLAEEAKKENAEPEKNIWMDKLAEGNGVAVQGENSISILLKGGVADSYRRNFRLFIDWKDAKDYADWLDKNAKKIYARYVLETILNRDYMPEPIDWDNKSQIKFGIGLDDDLYDNKWAVSYSNLICRQGMVYCTYPPDIDKIKNEMGELMEALL
jgi:hypothetical protein